jgi:glycosyltransferase involved in cell wall biosynthesis
MIYYHVWDNYPYPTFNKRYYDSNDIVCTISKVTDDIVRTVSPDIETIRVPHTVDTSVFKNKRNLQETLDFRKIMTGEENTDKILFFWNNRNARRKQPGSLIFWFKEFLDIVGHDKASLIMHTEPKDPNGQDLQKIINSLELNSNQVLLSTQKLPPDRLASVYSAVDCTINISDAEGFGLSTLESLACETPIIVNMTGGLQEQVTDGEEWFGFGITPVSKAIIGSQDVPWIHEDRISKEQFLENMIKFYNLADEDRRKLGISGREHVLKNYGFDSFQDKWVEIFDNVVKNYGSWKTRKKYKRWTIKEIK